MALLTQSFDGAQTFFIDSARMNGAAQCMISAVDLFFKHKPAIGQNFSGTQMPGVSLFIAETMYGVPRITRQSGIFTDQVARVPYLNIQTSSNASLPTRFRFGMPILVDTDKEYSFIWRFDLHDQFVLWTSKQGDLLVGTNTISPGPSGRYIGNYYEFMNTFVADDSTDLDQYLANWKSISDTDLKFNVHVARYSHSGVPVTSNSSIDPSSITENLLANVEYSNSGASFDIRFGSYEYISFSQEKSVKSAFVGGQYVYQNTFSYPGGYYNNKTAINVATVANSITVTAATYLPNGSVFQWSSLFDSSAIAKKIVLVSGDVVNVRKVRSIVSNTVITLDEPVSFTNSIANFMITPVGTVSGFDKNSPFGVSESFILLANSTANSTVRFVNTTMEAISVSVGGSGYSNSDVIYFKGYEDIPYKVNGGYMAKANLVTNSTGGITTLYLSNCGCGFSNSSNVTVVVANSTSLANTTGNTSAGSGATFTYSIGATMETDMSPNIFRDCKVRNLDVGEFIPYLELRNPPGVSYKFEIQMNYLKKFTTSTSSGEEYFVNPYADVNRVPLAMYATNYTETTNNIPILPSKSNEFVIRYEDGSVNDKITNTDTNYSLSFHLLGNVTSNSDYTCTMIKGLPSVHFAKYIVNNDYTNENTDSGNAWSRHITKVFNFTRPAEDIRVYITAYRPANTDIKVYARVFKHEDTDAFDDKEWTLLELKEQPPLSSSVDSSDYVEMTYGFYQYPPDRTELTGLAKTTLDSATVAGSNTVWSNDLAAGSLILLRQELFPNNHIVAVVNAVASNTSLTLTEPISNSSLVAEGLKIDLINTPHQTFNNIQKDNVARYHNSSITKYDGYDTVMLKVVFLSDTPHRVPRIDSIQCTGLSA